MKHNNRLSWSLIILIALLSIRYVAAPMIDDSHYFLDFSNASQIQQDIDADKSIGVIMDGALQAGPQVQEFLSRKDVILRPITTEEAAKYNASEWIWINGKFLRIIRLKPNYVENINVSVTPIQIDGHLERYDPGEYFSKFRIVITVNETAVLKDFDSGVLQPLNFTYNGRVESVKYDYTNRQYVFETDKAILGGRRAAYPFDKYELDIVINGGELNKQEQDIPSDLSSFLLQVLFDENKIKISRTRKLPFRYILGVIGLICFTFTLIRRIRRLPPNSFTTKIKFDFISVVISIILLGLIPFSMDMDYLISVGIVPFLISFLVISFAIKKKLSVKQNNH